MAEDTLIAQDSSAVATNVHHLEHAVGPRRIRRTRPLDGLDTTSV